MSEEGTGATRLSPDDAFSALGSEMRVRILRELGTADGPLAFSELYERLDLSDSARFNYHLDKLLGHFVHKIDDEYALASPGERVVEAILSGAVTDDPRLERTPTDQHCTDCGRRLEIEWQNGNVEVYCPECESRWNQSWGRVGGPVAADSGYLGRLPLPPAGLKGRSPTAVFRAARMWSNLELIAVSAGLCPRCSATVERELLVCDDHEADDGVCPACESSFAVRLVARCTNCIYTTGTGAAWGLLATPELTGFLFEQGLNPLAPENPDRLDSVLSGYDEEIVSKEPFRAEFTFSADDESLTLCVNRSLEVLDST
ncbi:winged helix-turn-helix domain-containing protein [Halovenus salina]|uniref:winged helix-turn-helix domain-containing protein n=1 Tax=Halovenus salina TaxID=1510225 RepID=UPI002260E35D|nr:helix-turn-helix domain-containing protein [Halovenus salina]